MRCEYSDGLKVDYSGSLKIIKGAEINVFMKEGVIPDPIKGELDRAAGTNNCGDMRRIAQDVTAAVGNRACIHV